MTKTYDADLEEILQFQDVKMLKNTKNLIQAAIRQKLDTLCFSKNYDPTQKMPKFAGKTFIYSKFLFMRTSNRSHLAIIVIKSSKPLFLGAQTV